MASEPHDILSACWSLGQDYQQHAKTYKALEDMKLEDLDKTNWVLMFDLLQNALTSLGKGTDRLREVCKMPRGAGRPRKPVRPVDVLKWKKLGMKVSWIASRCGVSRSTIHRILQRMK